MFKIISSISRFHLLCNMYAMRNSLLVKKPTNGIYRGNVDPDDNLRKTDALEQ